MGGWIQIRRPVAQFDARLFRTTTNAMTLSTYTQQEKHIMDTPYGTPAQTKRRMIRFRAGFPSETVIGRTKQMATEQVEAGVWTV